MDRVKSTLLFVEDEPNMLELFCKVFSEKGYHVLTAKNGIEAMEILMDHTPDLIVSDIMMPEMDGLTFFKSVQERFGAKRPVFIFLTAKREENDVINGLGLGADDYITKPVSIRQLVLRVGALLKRIEEQRHLTASGLTGNLKEQSIADIIQFLELSKHTGKISISTFGKTAEIHVREGRVIWAEFLPLTGIEAVYATIALQDGTFQFDTSAEIVPSDKITIDNYAIILEGLKRIDEIGRDALLAPVLKVTPISARIEALLPSEAVNDATLFQSDEDDTQIIENFTIGIYKPSFSDWFNARTFRYLNSLMDEIEPGSYVASWREKSSLLSEIIPYQFPGLIVLSKPEILSALFKTLSPVFSTPTKPDHLPYINILCQGLSSVSSFILTGMSNETIDNQFLNKSSRYPVVIVGDYPDASSQALVLQTNGCPCLFLVSDKPEEDRTNEAFSSLLMPCRFVSLKSFTWMAIILMFKKIFNALETLSMQRDSLP